MRAALLARAFCRLLAPALLAVAAGRDAAVVAAPVAPVERLQQTHGLTRTGQVWLSATEVRLRRKLDQLPEIETRIETLRRELDASVERNLAAWLTYQAAEGKLARLVQAQRVALPGARRGLMEDVRRERERVALLKQQAVDPVLLGETPAVQSRLIELSDGLASLLLSVFWLREHWPSLADEYARLAAQADVAAALAELSNSARLGPARDYQGEIEKLARYEQFVYRLPVPLYRESGRLRVAALVNDRTPVTFSWRSGSGPVTLTCNMIEAAGLEVPADAARVTWRVDNQRVLTVRKFTVPYLRLGRYLLQDVPAFALPPEGEDLGAEINPGVLAGYTAVPDPARLQLTIEPAE